jgi:hypothetical protein
MERAGEDGVTTKHPENSRKISPLWMALRTHDAWRRKARRRRMAGRAATKKDDDDNRGWGKGSLSDFW